MAEKTPREEVEIQMFRLICDKQGIDIKLTQLSNVLSELIKAEQDKPKEEL